ncbi:MAG: transglycosylase SLT domain-containing protein [Synergistaceae bacterium]
MRENRHLREILKIQFVFLVILAIVIVSSPLVVMGKTNEEVSSDAMFESCSITETSYEADADGELKQVSTKTTDVYEEDITADDVNFEASVLSALKAMKVTEDDIAKWVEQHPKSTLASLHELSPSQQREVANIATFIRKVNKNVDVKTAWRESCAIVTHSKKYDIPVDLVVGVAKTESTFNPNTKSHMGAVGVMQVVWKVHHGMLSAKGIAKSKEQMHDPEIGVEAGVLLLSRYIDAYGTVQKALSRYYGSSSKKYMVRVSRTVAQLNKHSENTGF